MESGITQQNPDKRLNGPNFIACGKTPVKSWCMMGLNAYTSSGWKNLQAWSMLTQNMDQKCFMVQCFWEFVVVFYLPKKERHRAHKWDQGYVFSISNVVKCLRISPKQFSVQMNFCMVPSTHKMPFPEMCKLDAKGIPWHWWSKILLISRVYSTHKWLNLHRSSFFKSKREISGFMHKWVPPIAADGDSFWSDWKCLQSGGVGLWIWINVDLGQNLWCFCILCLGSWWNAS